MAELGHPDRIHRVLLTRLDDGAELYKRSADGRWLGGVAVDTLLPDDTLPEQVATAIFPVVAERDDMLIASVWPLAAELARRGKSEGSLELRVAATALGAWPNAALSIPRVRVKRYETV